MVEYILLVVRFLLIGALYGFLGWAVWLIWRDLNRQAHASPLSEAPQLSLQLGDGVVLLSSRQPEVVVGRDPTCDCPIDDKTISARHARFSYHHAQWWLEDLHSRNGTFLNGQAIKEAVVLTSGDQARFGQVLLHVMIEDRAEIEKHGSV